MRETHAHEASSYDIGRPDYQEEFFDYLYAELGLEKNAVVADIGAGTGKITRRFLEKGSRVYAVEPDKSMMRVLKTKLASYSDCSFIANAAGEHRNSSSIR